jgi:ABC-2 type transport system permease protein
MSALTPSLPAGARGLADELRKLPAFFRRDFLVAWSYRFAFVSDWAGMALQIVLFSFVGRIVDPTLLPAYGGHATSYVEFVAIGVAMSSLIQLALHRVAAALRQEQMLGTLEALLMTPTTPTTIQVGTVFYDLVYIPIRSCLFLAVVALVFGLHLHASGILPAAIAIVVFIPFVWGLGVATAGLLLTLRRGMAVTGFGAAVLMALSGAYFPLDVLPSWLHAAANANPVAVAIEAVRRALIGGEGWTGIPVAVAQLAPAGIVSLVVGLVVFRVCLRRELRRGSLGLY